MPQPKLDWVYPDNQEGLSPEKEGTPGFPHVSCIEPRKRCRQHQDKEITFTRGLVNISINKSQSLDQKPLPWFIIL